MRQLDTLDPSDPVAAVTHRNPYPYYTRLAHTGSLTHDRARGHWVVADAESVLTILTHPCCRVRPIDEPVPLDLRSTPIEAVYRHFARMTDGVAHDRCRAPVADALLSLAPAEVIVAASACSRMVMDEPTWRPDGPGVTTAMWDIPVRTVAALLDIPSSTLGTTTIATRALVRAMRPGATDMERRVGSEAVRVLRGALVTAAGAGRGPRRPLAVLRRENSRLGLDADAAVAAAIGMLVQTCEATAGLIGNALVHLSRRPRPSAQREGLSVDDTLDEVLRLDPPVQNTRRYAAESTAILGTTMDRGATILVVLAAANRSLTTPGRTKPRFPHPPFFSFGHGPHACPGQSAARLIAGQVVEVLLSAGIDVHQLGRAFSYRPSVNTRIPIFAPSSDL